MTIFSSFIAIFLGLAIITFVNSKYESLLRYVAMSTTFFVFFQAGYMLCHMDPSYTGYHFISSVHVAFFDYDFGYLYFGLDGLSCLFYFLSAFLSFLCMMYILPENTFKYYAFTLLVIELLLLVIFSAMDLIFFYIGFEALLIPMYFLIGIWGSRERKIRASYSFFFYTLGSSLLMLLAILYIYNTVHTLSFVELYCKSSAQFTISAQLCLWLAFFVSFATKVPMYPTHIWLPEAHVEAPTVGSVLLAGILLKLGIYGIMRVNLGLFPDASIVYAPFVMILAVTGVVYASLCALGQSDLKRIIAYSSIAHMNLVVAGLFSLKATGFEAAIFQSISHGFVSAGLFFLIGMIYDRYHTRSTSYYYGLAHFMPVFSSFFLVFTLANIAVPGTSSFIGEYILLLSTFKYSFTYGISAAFGVVLCGTYSLWLSNRIMYGKPRNGLTVVYRDLEMFEVYILLMLFNFILIIGIFPDPFVFDFIESSCGSLEDFINRTRRGF